MTNFGEIRLLQQLLETKQNTTKYFPVSSAKHKTSVTIVPILQSVTIAKEIVAKIVTLSYRVVDWCFVTAKAARNRAFPSTDTMTSRSCGHYGCNFQEECLKCHSKITKELVEAKKVALKKRLHPNHSAGQTVASSTKAPKKVSPPSARRPKRAVRSIYQRDEPMEESESKKAKKRTKSAVKQVLPAPLSPANKQSSSNKRPTKPDKAVRKSRKKCSFPQNLHALITEAASVAPAVVSWFEGGEAFIVHDPESAKLGELLQKHFNRKFRL